MKKRLLCLPLAVVMMSGCSVMGINLDPLGLIDKTKELIGLGGNSAGGNQQTGGNNTTTGGGGGNNTTGGGNTSGGGGSSISGTPFATVTLKGCKDAESTSARPLVFSNGGATVTIGQSSATTDMAQAITNTKTYEFRIYKGMSVDFSANKSFSKLLITYSTWKETSGTTYYFDMELEGATNEHDDTTGQAIVTLDSASTSYSCGDMSHQTRVASVAFYA